MDGLRVLGAQRLRTTDRGAELVMLEQI